MPNKELRFLIADEQQLYRLTIERELNQLGYYRVAPMSRLDEALSVLGAGCEPLDLVLINARMAKEAEFDLVSFCIGNPQIRHALIYGGDHVGLQSVPWRSQHHVWTSALRLPDLSTLGQLMAHIDPRVGPVHCLTEAQFVRATLTQHREKRWVNTASWRDCFGGHAF